MTNITEISITWGDIYGDSPQQVVELDEGGKALISLIPESNREQMEPLLRGMLAQMHAQLGTEKYMLFCVDMRRAYEFHTNGDQVSARLIFEAYGIPYDSLLTMAASAS